MDPTRSTTPHFRGKATRGRTVPWQIIIFKRLSTLHLVLRLRGGSDQDYGILLTKSKTILEFQPRGISYKRRYNSNLSCITKYPYQVFSLCRSQPLILSVHLLLLLNHGVPRVLLQQQKETQDLILTRAIRTNCYTHIN